MEQCLAAGLVWGQELYTDATKVAANAALASLRPRFAVEAHLAHLFHADAGPGPGEESGERDGNGEHDEREPLPITWPEEANAEPAAHARHGHDWIGQAGRPDRDETSGTYRRTADFRVSTTDPDATPMPLANGHTHLGYQDH